MWRRTIPPVGIVLVPTGVEKKEKRQNSGSPKGKGLPEKVNENPIGVTNVNISLSGIDIPDRGRIKTVI